MASKNYKIFIGKNQYDPEGYTAICMGGQIFNIGNAGTPSIGSYIASVSGYYGASDELEITIDFSKALPTDVSVYFDGSIWDESHEITTLNGQWHIFLTGTDGEQFLYAYTDTGYRIEGYSLKITFSATGYIPYEITIEG